MKSIKPLLCLLAFALAVFAQNPIPAVFPAALAADSDMCVGATSPSISTTLTSAISGSSATLAFPVASSIGFVVGNCVRTELEWSRICSIPNGTTLTMCAGTRGLFASTAASHIAGKVVGVFTDGIYFNTRGAEIVALENLLGVNGVKLNPTTTQGDFIVRGPSALARLAPPSNGTYSLTFTGGTWTWTAAASSSGISTLNTLNGVAQSFATGTLGIDFAISSSGTTHTFNLPNASASNRGALTSADWTTFNSKQASLPWTTAGDVLYHNGTNPVRLAQPGNGTWCWSFSGGVPSWLTCPTGFSNPMTTAGDLIIGGTAGAPARLAAGTGYLHWNGASYVFDTPVGTATAGSYAIDSFTGNGATTAFTLTGTPVANSLDIYVNGQLMLPGALLDYTLTGAVTTFNAGSTPANATRITAHYVTAAATVGPPLPWNTAGDFVYFGAGGPARVGQPGNGTWCPNFAGGVFTWTACPGAASGANSLGTYIVQTATNAPVNAQIMAALGTGIVKNTTGTGVHSIAVAADFPTLNQATTGNAATATALATLPTKCSAGNFPLGIDVLGNAQNCTAAGAGSMVYPGAGVPLSTGAAWGASYTVGAAANNLVQLNGSVQLPAVSAFLLTNFPTLNQNTTGSAASFTGLLVGDVTGTQGATTVARINGTTITVNGAADQIVRTTAAATAAWTGIPLCLDAAGQHLNYDTTTHLFSCGSTGAAAGSAAFNTISTGTNTTATMSCASGCSISPAGPTTGVVNANQINGVAMSTLITGLVANTFTSGTPRTGNGADVMAPLICPATSASGANYACSTTPTFSVSTGTVVLFVVDVTSSSAPSFLTVNSFPRTIRKASGAVPAPGELRAGQRLWAVFDGSYWVLTELGPFIPNTTNVLVGNGSGDTAAVTGTAGNCVHVDGSSGACGGGSASFCSSLITVVGQIITLPTSCLIKTGQDSDPVASPSGNSITVPGGANGSVLWWFDRGVYWIGHSLSSPTCGGGANCLPGTALFPQGVHAIARFTVTSGSIAAATLKDGETQNAYTFNGFTQSEVNGDQQITYDSHDGGVLKVSGTSDALTSGPSGNLNKQTSYSNSGSVSITVPQAGTAGFANGQWFGIINNSASGTDTMSTTTSQWYPSGSNVVAAGASVRCTTDGVDYYCQKGGGTGGAGTNGVAILTATQTWTVPPGITHAWPQVWGPGGGGGGGIQGGTPVGGQGGPGGGFSEGHCAVSGTVAATVGTGGAGASAGTAAGSSGSGNSSFGTCKAATPGTWNSGHAAPGYEAAFGPGPYDRSDGTYQGYALFLTGTGPSPSFTYKPLSSDLGSPGGAGVNGTTGDGPPGSPARMAGAGGGGGAVSYGSTQAAGIGGTSAATGAAGNGGSLTSGTANACTSGSGYAHGGGGGAASNSSQGAGCAGLPGRIIVWY